MRPLILLAGLAALPACGDGDACRQLCDEKASCGDTGTQSSDACYDDVKPALSLALTRRFALASCQSELDAFSCPE